MSRVKFGDVVKETKVAVDRTSNPFEFYVAGDHMDTDDLTIRRKGRFDTDDVGPAFIRVFRKGQILYGSRRTYLRKVAVADFDGITANTTFVLETKDSAVLLQELLPYLMLSESFTSWSVAKSRGSTNPYVLFSDLATYEFDLPDLSVQRGLVEKFRALFAAKEAYRKLLSATDELVKSQFVEMFGRFSFEKECIRMGALFEISSSRRILKSEWVSSGVPFLRVRDLVQLADCGTLSNEFYVSEAFYNRLTDDDGKVRAGDFLVSATSTVGKIHIVREGERFYYKDADVLRLRKKRNINDSYFSFALGMPFIKKQIDSGMGATTVNHFLISKAKEILVPMPPSDLQDRFAAFVAAADKSKFAARQSLERLDAVYRALSKETFG